jgi:NAD(P)-dependent dehydrogenase (short-subunit alcohol dehydrogenase family)
VVDCHVIVGAGSGIGRSLLRLFSHRTAGNFLLFDRAFDGEFLEEFSSLSSRFFLVEDNIRPETDWDLHFSRITSVSSFVFLLPQCRSRDAGVGELGFTEYFPSNISDVNFSLLKCLETLKTKLTLNANILFVSSILASRVAVDDSSLDYHASKAVLESIMRYMAVKLAPVSVNCIAPGLISRDAMSPLASNDSIVSRVRRAIPLGRASSQDEVAQVCWVLCSGALPYVSGQTIVMDGGGMVLEAFNITGR